MARTDLTRGGALGARRRVRRVAGSYARGERFIALLPRDHRPDSTATGVLWCPGHGEDHRQGLWRRYMYHLNAAIAEAGHPVMCIDAGGPATWANDASRSAIGAALTHLRSVLGASPRRVALAGVSLGALDALGWAAAHRDGVAGLALYIPAVDLMRHYESGHPSYARREIEAAYGGASRVASEAASRNPAAAPERYAGMPIAAWYASDDASAPAAWTEAFLSGAGPSAVGRSLGPVGHDPGSIDPGEVVAFLSRLG